MRAPPATAFPIDVGRVAVPRAADRRAALALALVDGVGPVSYRRWATADGGADASLARRVDAAGRARALAAADEVLRRTADAGAALLLADDPDYPAPLLELPDPPPALWCLGDSRLLAPAAARVAIVGTRSATPYGHRATSALAGAAADAGAVVVSGMALGIDATAHLAPLDRGARTIAVLGSGVDVPYPRAHRALHRRIVAHGLVLSELPPGTAPTAGAFPRRNRIVAALSQATLVVEAGARSGALITAAVALDLGRDVGAVPGPVDAPESAGTNALLRDGAAVIAEPADLLDLLGLATRPATGTARRDQPAAAEPVGLGDDERAVWTALAAPAADADALAARAGVSPRACGAALGMLEAAGHVRVALDGSVSRR